MNHLYEGAERERLIEARESFSGRLLTDVQFEEAISITGIMEAEIQKSGRFKEKLGDYAHAFARTERFDAVKSESTIRDLYKARTGETMNETRERLMAREAAVDKDRPRYLKQGLDSARAAGRLVEQGNKMSFFRAATHVASSLSKDLGITQVAARRLMREGFEETEKRDFNEWGKSLDEKFYRPQIETAQQSRREMPVRDMVSRGRGFARAR